MKGQQTNLSPQTTPTSPNHPSIHNLPSLEFTINSSQVNNYMSGSVYRNGVVSVGGAGTTVHLNGLGAAGMVSGGGSAAVTGESLPPSPQSQHSCFNSPQNSPGPLSISPQDLNPFSTNSYDIMHKKFDSINLVSRILYI
jgi:hypothetical protein